jgi:hypothetical protein
MITRASMAAMGVALFVFLAACGSGSPTPSPTATPPATATPPPTTAPPTPASTSTAAPPAATPTPDAPAPAQAALLEARERWERSGIADYSYTGAWTCFCPEEYLADAQVTVAGGTVTAVHSAAADVDTIPAPERFLSIEGLFALIEDALVRGAARVEVSYDETYGYPVELFIDYDERMADEEDRFTISSFTAT